MAAAQKAATTYKLEKDMRVRDIRAELKRVDALHRAAEVLAADPTEQAGSKADGTLPPAPRSAGGPAAPAVAAPG